MSGSRSADALVIIDGPEDGAEFAINRTPLYAGSDSHCEVVIRLDDAVTLRHARFTVESDGYRVRSATGAPIFVNGKRAGMIRSRVAGNGDRIKLGNTSLTIECCGGGLASRSHGIGSASDLAWAVRIVVRNLGRALSWSARMLWDVYRMFFSSWLILVAAAIVLYFAVPQVRYWVDGAVNWIRNTLGAFLA